MDPEIGEKCGSYLFEWIVGRYSTGEKTELGPADGLFFVRPGSGKEQELLRSHKVLKSARCGPFRCHICRRSAAGMLSFESYGIFNRHLFEETPTHENRLEKRARYVRAGATLYVLIASQAAPPYDLYDATKAEVVFEILIEQAGPDLLVGCQLQGLQCEKLEEDVLKGPHVVIVRSGDRGSVRLDVPYAEFRRTLDRRNLVAKTRLRGWAPGDVADVLCGVDYYLDASHYRRGKRFEWSVLTRKWAVEEAERPRAEQRSSGSP
jgi:hypothetical protein